jgi:hypothetical protein
MSLYYYLALKQSFIFEKQPGEIYSYAGKSAYSLFGLYLRQCPDYSNYLKLYINIHIRRYNFKTSGIGETVI